MPGVLRTSTGSRGQPRARRRPRCRRRPGRSPRRPRPRPRVQHRAVLPGSRASPAAASAGGSPRDGTIPLPVRSAVLPGWPTPRSIHATRTIAGRSPALTVGDEESWKQTSPPRGDSAGDRSRSHCRARESRPFRRPCAVDSGGVRPRSTGELRLRQLGATRLGKDALVPSASPKARFPRLTWSFS